VRRSRAADARFVRELRYRQYVLARRMMCGPRNSFTHAAAVGDGTAQTFLPAAFLRSRTRGLPRRSRQQVRRGVEDSSTTHAACGTLLSQLRRHARPPRSPRRPPEKSDVGRMIITLNAISVDAAPDHPSSERRAVVRSYKPSRTICYLGASTFRLARSASFASMVDFVSFVARSGGRSAQCSRSRSSARCAATRRRSAPKNRPRASPTRTDTAIQTATPIAIQTHIGIPLSMPQSRAGFPAAK
jgi:hypothetical protein